MRPGFYTRKSIFRVEAEVGSNLASMRPGFYTRKSGVGQIVGGAAIPASMRPGFYTRKSGGMASRTAQPSFCFNEAGILHPEKPGEVKAEYDNSHVLQ